MASDGCVIAKDRILDVGFAALHRFEKCKDVRPEIIPVITGVNRLLGKRLFRDRWVVLLVPLTNILCAHFRRKAAVVVTGLGIDSSLRNILDTGSCRIEQSLWTHIAGTFRCLCA